MEQPVLMRTIGKLARAGEQVGISVEDMISILNAGISVEVLLDLIELHLQASREETSSSERNRVLREDKKISLSC
jgi:hypothetical protein